MLSFASIHVPEVQFDELLKNLVFFQEKLQKIQFEKNQVFSFKMLHQNAQQTFFSW